jgi:hypothetical protein
MWALSPPYLRYVGVEAAGAPEDAAAFVAAVARDGRGAHRMDASDVAHQVTWDTRGVTRRVVGYVLHALAAAWYTLHGTRYIVHASHTAWFTPQTLHGARYTR